MQSSIFVFPASRHLQISLSIPKWYHLTIRASECVQTSQRTLDQCIGPTALLHSQKQKVGGWGDRETKLMSETRRSSGRKGGGTIDRIRNERCPIFLFQQSFILPASSLFPSVAGIQDEHLSGTVLFCGFRFFKAILFFFLLFVKDIYL